MRWLKLAWGPRNRTVIRTQVMGGWLYLITCPECGTDALSFHFREHGRPMYPYVVKCDSCGREWASDDSAVCIGLHQVGTR